MDLGSCHTGRRGVLLHGLYCYELDHRRILYLLLALLLSR